MSANGSSVVLAVIAVVAIVAVVGVVGISGLPGITAAATPTAAAAAEGKGKTVANDCMKECMNAPEAAYFDAQNDLVQACRAYCGAGEVDGSCTSEFDDCCVPFTGDPDCADVTILTVTDEDRCPGQKYIPAADKCVDEDWHACNINTPWWDCPGCCTYCIVTAQHAYDMYGCGCCWGVGPGEPIGEEPGSVPCLIVPDRGYCVNPGQQ